MPFDELYPATNPMNDKITIHYAPHGLGAIQLALASFYEQLHSLTLYEWALVTTVIISPLAFIASIVFQWRQTRAIERAAREGRVVAKPRMFK
ncbi:hypothetical protein G9G39_00255 [Cronobacter sp. EKM101R]|nr:hypothetical protein [Cronobacter sakazakii]KAF6597551.1 hypothetical protein G9G39_00255 [Cronobacter sp. EKM101R]KAF6598541.1 hypothetical protein G9G38_10075 [Cronobacter sp. EKM102R]